MEIEWNSSHQADDDGSEVPHQESKRGCNLADVAGDPMRPHDLVTKLEPMLRRVVQDEVEKIVTPFHHSSSRSSFDESDPPQRRGFQLHFDGKLPVTLYTCCRIEPEDSKPIKILLFDASKEIISAGPLSSMKVEIVPLDGDFGANDQGDWTEQEFNAKIVHPRMGKRPLVTGNLVITLRNGVGEIKDVSFTDNSSWIRSRRFRLGARAVSSNSNEVRVREARSEPFLVKDQRGESYKKHHPPNLDDEIWRLERIAKDGVCHKRLSENGITTVQHFLRSYHMDASSLRKLLGPISDRQWKIITEHASACVPDDKLYTYRREGEMVALVVNSVFKVVGVTFDGQYYSYDKLDAYHKDLVEKMANHAYKNMNDLVQFDPLLSPSPPSNLLAHPFANPSASLQHSNFAGLNQATVDSGLLVVEKGRDPTGKKVAIHSDEESLLLKPRYIPLEGSKEKQPLEFVKKGLGWAGYDTLMQLRRSALQGRKLSAAEKQIVENMIGKCSDLDEEEELKEILWLEGHEGVTLSSISRHETETLKKLRKKAWELKRKFDLLVMFLYPMKTNATEESLPFTARKFPVTNNLLRRIKASILTNNHTGLLTEEINFDCPGLSRTESVWDFPVLSPNPSFFKIWEQQLCEVEKDLDKYDFDIATYRPRDMVENMNDPPGIDVNYSTSSTKPAELTFSSTSTKSANATRRYEEQIAVSRHEVRKFRVNSAVQQVVKYFEARRNGKIGISGSGWEEVTKALKDLPKIRNMFDIVQNVSVSNYESVIELQQNVEQLQGPSSFQSSLGRPSRILLLVDYIDQRIDVDDLEFFDFADSVCIVLNTRPENVNEILALDLEIRLEDCLLPWNLFCNNAGRVLVDSYNLQQKAMRLVEECHGNLIAIILLARILKGAKDYSVWEVALHEITCQRSSQFPQGTGVILINALRFAWERMSTDATKQNCIRYCLLQNGNKIDREALIYQGVRSGWIETVNKGEDVLKELTSSFLLEDINEHIFLMREEIRLALMNILVVGKLPSYLDHGDIERAKTAEMVKWVDKERNQMNSKLSELPECPYCPSLEKLSLQENYDLMVIPSSFFLCMPALKVLNLSYTSIKCLPKSVSKLVNLEEFFLRGCDLLMELPIEIGELEKLELCDFEGTPLSYLPEEIGKIDQLRSLKVTLNARANLIWKTKDVNRIVPMKCLSERTQFKELSIDVHPDGNWWDIEVTSILNELAGFKCLNTLKLYLPNVEALKHIRWYRTTLIHPALECFRIIVGHYCFLSRIPHELEVEFNNLEKFEKGLKYMNGEGIVPEISKLLKSVSAVALERHWVLKNLSELGLRNLSNLKFCCLAECNELQTIIDSEQICKVDLEEDDSDESESECEEENVLSSLQYLSIHYMKKLESICRGRVSKTCLSSLKSMALHTCLSLTTIFTKEVLDNLTNLKELIVEDCPKISSLVSPECSDSTSDEYLPSLKKISLLELPELVNISNGLCIAPRLESMVIFYCPKIIILSSTEVSSRNLDVFKGEEEWWNALDWNEQNTDHKNYLTGIFTPLSGDMDMMMADLAKIRLTTTI